MPRVVYRCVGAVGQTWEMRLVKYEQRERERERERDYGLLITGLQFWVEQYSK